MIVEQQILTDLIEQLSSEGQIWRKLDRKKQLDVIHLIGDLICRDIRNNQNTHKQGEPDD